MTIRLAGLGKRYNRDWIFRNLNSELTADRCTAILGPNGSGKSTLLSVLWNQIPPSEGRVDYIDGTISLDQDEIHKYISLAAPYMELPEELTLREMIKFHFSFKESVHLTSEKSLPEYFGLSSFENRFIREFSSGMKQRLKLGLALFSKVPVTFLDEPTTNLDQQGIAWYKELLEQTKDRILIIATNNHEDYPENAQVIKMTDFKPY
jgi:ABC-type multidrug transport system ATPase subunit